MRVSQQCSYSYQFVLLRLFVLLQLLAVVKADSLSFRCVIITGGWSTGRSRMSAGGSTALWIWDWDGSCLPAQKEEREEAKLANTMPQGF